MHHHHHEETIDYEQFATLWQALPTMLKYVIGTTITVTGLVILMMTLIELINVSSSGKLMNKLHKHPFAQLLTACLLGAIPGCAGGFAVVSMFTHNMISFGALIGGMVTTFGDEAFFLFAQSPKWGLILTAILFGLGIVIGLVFDLFSKRWKFALEPHEFEIHEAHDLHEHHHSSSDSHGFWGHVSHFFKEHLWEHVIKKHLLSIFCWTFGVLLFLQILNYFIDIHTLMHTHEQVKYLILLIAVLIGFVPESGPHLIFIAMFLEGTIPFGILLANSIAQNGHAGLPLLAQSRKNFFLMKAITMGIGLIVGLILI